MIKRQNKRRLQCILLHVQILFFTRTTHILGVLYPIRLELCRHVSFAVPSLHAKFQPNRLDSFWDMALFYIFPEFWDDWLLVHISETIQPIWLKLCMQGAQNSEAIAQRKFVYPSGFLHENLCICLLDEANHISKKSTMRISSFTSYKRQKLSLGTCQAILHII